MFERIIPEAVNKFDPETFYWPSSPSSGGGFDKTCEEGYGDAHYWDVWHGKKPFEDFEKLYFRFASEYGFQSVPSLKTLRAFARGDDFNLFSNVMEKHQKCIDNGHGKCHPDDLSAQLLSDAKGFPDNSIHHTDFTGRLPGNGNFPFQKPQRQMPGQHLLAVE